MTSPDTRADIERHNRRLLSDFEVMKAEMLHQKAEREAAEADAARLAHAASIVLDLTTREWPELRVALTLHNERIET